MLLASTVSKDRDRGAGLGYAMATFGSEGDSVITTYWQGLPRKGNVGSTCVMTDWTPDELQSIASTDDVHISPFRADGITLGTPTWIWSVVVDGVMYVRAYNGTSSRWYGSAASQRAGPVTAGGTEKDVAFVPIADQSLNDRIDDAYRTEVRHEPLPAPDAH